MPDEVSLLEYEERISVMQDMNKKILTREEKNLIVEELCARCMHLELLMKESNDVNRTIELALRIDQLRKVVTKI